MRQEGQLGGFKKESKKVQSHANQISYQRMTAQFLQIQNVLANKKRNESHNKISKIHTDGEALIE